MLGAQQQRTIVTKRFRPSTEAAYADLVQSGVSPAQGDALTRSALSGWALGEPDFVAELQKRTERRVSKLRAGRPLASLKVD